MSKICQAPQLLAGLFYLGSGVGLAHEELVDWTLWADKVLSF